jgi:RNA polymerase sigma-70 factor (ECF subfamily)
VRVRAAGADLAEIEAVYRSRLAAFRRVARAVVGDSDAARDAVQEAFAQAVRNRKSFRGEGTVEAWIWRAVVNAARMQWRAGARSELHDAPEPASTNGHPPDPDLPVREAIAALPERQRLAVFLRYYADLDYAAIADVLEISPGTVAATLNAARAAVRRQLPEVRQ